MDALFGSQIFFSSTEFSGAPPQLRLREQGAAGVERDGDGVRAPPIAGHTPRRAPSPLYRPGIQPHPPHRRREGARAHAIPGGPAVRVGRGVPALAAQIVARVQRRVQRHPGLVGHAGRRDRPVHRRGDVVRRVPRRRQRGSATMLVPVATTSPGRVSSGVHPGRDWTEVRGHRGRPGMQTAVRGITYTDAPRHEGCWPIQCDIEQSSVGIPIDPIKRRSILRRRRVRRRDSSHDRILRVRRHAHALPLRQRGTHGLERRRGTRGQRPHLQQAPGIAPGARRRRGITRARSRRESITRRRRQLTEARDRLEATARRGTPRRRGHVRARVPTRGRGSRAVRSRLKQRGE